MTTVETNRGHSILLGGVGGRRPRHAQQLMLVEHDVLQLPRGEYAGWPLA